MPTVAILLSDKRSGSTMLQNELCSHSGIRHVDYSPHTYHETHHWLKAAVMLDQPAELFAGGTVYPGYGSRENARTYMIDTIKKNVPEFVPPEDDRELVFGGWEALCSKFAHPVFFEKSPQVLAQWSALTLLMQWMEKTDFDVRIIALVRNPLAVQYSAQELFNTVSSGRQFSWVRTQRNLLAFQSVAPKERFKLMKYEDLVADPSRGFGVMCEFLGVEMEAQIGAKVQRTSLEKWRQDKDFTLQLDPAVIQIAKVFGYSDAELENPNKPQMAARGRPISQADARSPFVTWLVKRRDRFLRPLALRTRRMFGRAR